MSAQDWSRKEPPTVAGGFARVYSQEPNAVTGDVSFIHRIDSGSPWYVATGSNVYIVSSITGQTP